MKDDMRFIVDYGTPDAVLGANTVEDLAEYLESDPWPNYRLASCQHNNGTYTLIWEASDASKR